MKLRIALLHTIAAATVMAAPAAAQQQGEFALPSSQPTPAPTGQVQGPVDDSGIVPVAPRVIGPTPTPTPAPTATQTTTPRAAPTATPTPRPTARTPAPRPVATSPARPTPSRPAPVPPAQAPQASPPPISDPVPEGRSAIDPIPPGGDAANSATTTGLPGTGGDVLPAAPSAPAIEQDPAQDPATPAVAASSFWWWILAALAGLVVLGAGFFLYRRRNALVRQPIATTASPGLMPAPASMKTGGDGNPARDNEAAAGGTAATSAPATPAPAPADPAPAPSPVPPLSRNAAPLGLETKIVRLQRSMMAITVTATISATNRGSKPIEDAVLLGDLVGAHNSAPLGEQLANGATDLAELEKMGSIGPGESVSKTIQIRRTISELHGIQQGSTVVFVPLLRIRVEGEGASPIASTVLVGHPPERSGGKPTPFRADAPPQVYSNVVGRALG